VFAIVGETSVAHITNCVNSQFLKCFGWRHMQCSCAIYPEDIQSHCVGDVITSLIWIPI